MNIAQLKSLLGMFPDDLEVWVQTTPDDLLSPLERHNMWLVKASLDERTKDLEQGKLCITAYGRKP